MSKVSIIGAGEVGASCATCLAERAHSDAKIYDHCGIPIRNLLSEDKVQEAIHRAQLGGEEIIGHLGRSGWYAAGAAVCEMVEAVICDQRRVFPACAFLKAEYRYKDIYLGVPVIIGKNGVERVIELELDEDDRQRFEISQQEVRKTLETISK